MNYWNHRQSLKELAKHLMFHSGAMPLLYKLRERRGLKVSHLDSASTSGRFEKIYRDGVWLMNESQQSLSGTGSDQSATETIRRELPRLIAKYRWKSLIDVGCGDWTWMRTLRLECRYTGLDIVPDVIDANRERYSRSGVEFVLGDAIQNPLPRADVALVREMLFHLSFADGKRALTNVKQSAKWLVATSDRLWFNSDIHTGDFRMINLHFSPYRLPPPEETVLDDFVSKGRVLAVWNTSSIPDY